ncbi:MAG: saccharopine dehydrogenase C-terminal domain-containing protein [Saprospiraceae bacterium]|jgi:saccharopine dehydrogenase-like NADP-dependent oxidoreductase|nr:saccharopine dehydrogenase NADP-binding domain-containing protein [Saprospiraceae bacterium]MBK9565345.1 saccharopine dehydrogenase NADP-binding domain-containing protein [Saprospiraceae bacterium]MBP6448021.1 saccharopine dehydrogenase NADP-binding domain-containing protein [Saprospiraceae bacterium]
MKSNIFIAGSGGIGQAAGLILLEFQVFDVSIYFGDVSQSAIDHAIRFVKEGCTHEINVHGVLMPLENSDENLDNILSKCDIILDCLPGSQAPRLAALARKHHCHYANLTEYVQETKDVIAIADGAEEAFVLQTGLAPGFINVLAHKLYEEFHHDFGVDIVNSMHMKVGAISKNAPSPHYYAFTWSPIGVATEYLKEAEVVRNHKKIKVPALSGLERIIIDGDEYEDNFTSGGAADLPDAFSAKIKNLDYKTLRYPGHYQWVKNSLSTIINSDDRIKALENIMLENIPSVEDDIVVIYASVEGKDQNGRLRRKEKSYKIFPTYVGNKRLRAIQTTTASALCEVAYMLLTHQWKGVILQSELSTDDFLNGPFVTAIYGKY